MLDKGMTYQHMTHGMQHSCVCCIFSMEQDAGLKDSATSMQLCLCIGGMAPVLKTA